MIFFSEINSQHPSFSFVEDLFISSFPEEERRPDLLQRQNVDSNALMHCLLVSDVDDSPLGFITYWRFPSFSYVEHFSVSPSFRNQGLGMEIINAFVEMQHLPVVLEAELPSSSPMSARRIAFYNRNGFEAFPQSYSQPPYPGRGGQPIPMLLLHSDSDSLPPFEQICNTIYKEVYDVCC